MIVKDFVYRLFGVLLDKYGSDYFNPKEQEAFIRQGISECFKDWADNFETNVQYQKYLLDFECRDELNSIKSFTKSDLSNPIYRLTAITAEFEVNCSGKTIRTDREVAILRKEERGRTQRTYYKSSSDMFPMYEYINNSYNILSDTPPLKLKVDYIKKYKNFNILEPNDEMEFTDESIENHIFKRCVTIITDKIEGNYSQALNEEKLSN